jgi:hypothetical protein
MTRLVRSDAEHERTDTMRDENPIRAVVVGVAMLLASAWFCRAGEVNYLETFDAYPYPLVSTNQHAINLEWPNDDLSTAPSNGLLRAWAAFPPHNPTNPVASVKSLVLTGPCRGEIRAGQPLELRADVLRVSGDGAYAALGWQQERLGYFLLKGVQEVGLVKYRLTGASSRPSSGNTSRAAINP